MSGPRELLRWQWDNYPGTHTTRVNLLLHICTMPFFWAGTALLLVSLLSLDWVWAPLGFGCLLVPLIAQGVGHKRLEPNTPAPFTSPLNFIARLALEQWITFPRYVLSGGWGQAFRDAR